MGNRQVGFGVPTVFTIKSGAGKLPAAVVYKECVALCDVILFSQGKDKYNDDYAQALDLVTCLLGRAFVKERGIFLRIK